MITDNENLFSDNQALAAAAITPSTNSIDLGAPGETGYKKSQLRRNMDVGHTPLLIQVTEDFVGPTSLNIKVQLADDSAFTVNLKDVISVDVPVADLIAGYISPIDELPRGIKQRYLRIAYTPNGVVTAGKIFSGIVGAVDGSYQGNK